MHLDMKACVPEYGVLELVVRCSFGRLEELESWVEVTLRKFPKYVEFRNSN